MSTFRKAFLSALDLTDTAQTARRIKGLMDHGHSLEDATTIDNAFQDAVKAVGNALGDVIDALPQPMAGDAAFYIMRGVLVNLDALENIMVKTAMEEASTRGIAIVVMNGSPDCDCETCVKARAANATSYRTH